MAVAVDCWRFFIVFEPTKPIKDPTGKCDSILVLCCKWIHPILYFYSNDIPLFAIPLVSVCLFVSILLLFSSLFVWIIFYLFCRKILKQGQHGKEQYLTHRDSAQEHDLKTLTYGLPDGLSTGYGFLKALRITGSTIRTVYVTTTGYLQLS